MTGRIFATWLAVAAVQPAVADQRGTAIRGAPQPVNERAELRLPGCLHIAGVPALKRNAQGDLVFTAQSATYERAGKQALLVPYERMQRVQVVSSHRVAAKTALALALIPYVWPASFAVAMTKQNYDAWVFQYETETGGLAGAVFHVPGGESKKCVEWLGRFGIEVEQVMPPSSPRANK